ncbi:TAXI family TRAP transporter solute-binding subunit [Patescibacteria group bacterium]|nr:TAXI family TRAP transporter solute-binding subunit [Patescibacteria group bacterium]
MMKSRTLTIVLTMMMIFASMSAWAQEKPLEFLRIAGGGMGGAWYLGAAKMATFAEKVWPKVSATSTPGAGIANLRRLQKGDYQLVFSFTSAVYPAGKGMPPFKEPIDLRFVASTNPAYIITVAHPSIKSFKDLAGKTINGGPRGGSGYAATVNIIEKYGLKGKTKIVSSDYDKMPDMQVDGVVDASLIYGSIPHLVPNEILVRRNVNFLPIDEEVRDKMVTENPGLVKLTIKPGSFKTQDSPVATVGSLTCIVARADIPDYVIYKLLKYAWEHRAELIDAHVVYKDFVQDTVPLGRTVPWHPGAEKFWKEIGMLK